jgi:membrane-bound lytic murein transglycosylase B
MTGKRTMQRGKHSFGARFPVRPLQVLLCLCLLQAPLTVADYASQAGTLEFMDEMVSEHGFEREGLVDLFADAQRQESILKAISRTAEGTKPWHEYRDIFLTERREREGIEFLRQHRAVLSRAQAETGVPAEIIVAILGVETYYGRIAGSYRVIDALSTLAFDYPPRSPFFRGELEAFLLLAREQGLDPLALKGSYAGAMGYGQFIPSSYRAYAVDYDGDGVADIWDNPEDAIGSVANYFARHNWRAGEAVVSRAEFSGADPDALFTNKLKPSFTIAEYEQRGLTPVQSFDLDAPASAMRFELVDAYEYWLGLHNFYVITRYNHSSMYAMSVFQLSQRIAGGSGG